MMRVSTSTQSHIHRPMVPMVSALVAGIALGAWRPGWLQPAVCGFVLVCAHMIYTIRQGRPGLVRPLLFCALSGYIAIQPWLISAMPEDHVSRFVGDGSWQVGGVIAERPRLEAKRWRFILKAETLANGNRRRQVSGRVIVSGRGAWPGAGRGDRVLLYGRLHAIRSFINPGGFDYERFMDFQAVRTRVYAKAGTLRIVSHKADSAWTGSLDRYRAQLADQMNKALIGFPQSTVQLLKALVLGDLDHLSPQVRQAFNRAGLGHVLAISGLHIGMVATVSFLVSRWLLAWIPLMLRRAWTRKAAALVSLIAVLGYGLLAGLSPSTQRAVIMGAIFLIGFWVGRRHDWFNTLALAGLILLIVHPPVLFSISFQLSFLAVLAILTGLSVRRGPTPEFNPALPVRLLGRLQSFIWVSLVAILGTLPVVLYYFNQVSTIGLAANLVVVPLVGMLILPAGLAGAAVSFLNVDLAALMWQIAAAGMDAVRILVQWAANWSWCAIQSVTPSGLEICLYYFLGALLVCWRRIPQPKTILAVVLIVAGLDTGYWLYQRFGRQELRVTAIDVGQGTANLVQFPGGYTALIDGGGFSDNTAFDVGAKIVAPLLWGQKIRTIDLLVLSHANSDHLNGLFFIMEHFKVKQVWSNGETSTGAGFRHWQRLIMALQIPHIEVADSTATRVLGGVQLKVLAPVRGFRQRSAIEPWRDLNNNSLVVQARYHDITFLFSGDIMADAEAELMARLGSHGLRCTVLIVPHHGSRSSSTSLFLRAVQPQEALISSGWRNRFGFPHAEVLQRLEAMGVRTWCTADHGAIQVRTDGKKYRIKTCRPFKP